jgi:Zn-finger nucleic acid-binding protein
MNCPVCNSPLVILELDTVEVDHCFDCHGTWLDTEEIEKLIGESQSAKVLLKSLKNADVDERLYPCPICSSKMKKVWVGDKEEILIDECKNLHGLWFDKGELNDLVKMAELGGSTQLPELLSNMFEDELNNQ